VSVVEWVAVLAAVSAVVWDNGLVVESVVVLAVVLVVALVVV
jgi:hypothetical protein